jgi:hypothetical protein
MVRSYSVIRKRWQLCDVKEERLIDMKCLGCLLFFSKWGIAQPLHQIDAHGFHLFKAVVVQKFYITDPIGLRHVSTNGRKRSKQSYPF